MTEPVLEQVDEGAEGRPLSYPHLMQLACAPWAITREYHAILSLFARRRLVDGLRASDEEIRQATAAARRPTNRGASGVAVIPIYGVIVPKATLMTEISGGTSLERLQSQVQTAVDDPQVGSILLDVDSPGGSVAMLEETAAYLRAAAARKPVVAIANWMAASAAYYLAAQAGTVVATPSGAVGSVGTLYEHLDISGMLEQEGVTATLLYEGDRKIDGHPYVPLTDEARQEIQAMVADYYGRFIRDVAKGRGVSRDKVLSDFGQGALMTARDALSAGMVDEVATFDQTVAKMLRGETKTRGGRAAGSTASVLAQEAAAELDDPVEAPGDATEPKDPALSEGAEHHDDEAAAAASVADYVTL